ncbi:putative integral membrane protein [Rhodovulum sp. PH10]|uniref:DUF4396 domain-containing protein n=1 Tax=Rhodovulum sp. PH10 TaxID=1187851 RepID=UPI00027C217A|nr:DUF4396 domain-containing protein [Rhodovulum sp. PH10]EJW13171.1 putative integral membrane protein [Rhodovulum sp. PH10]
MIPTWLHVLSIVSLLAGFAIAIGIAIDVMRHPQHMGIMNVVWPLSALFGTVIVLWGYLRYGRLATHEKAMPAMKNDETPPHKALTPFPVKVGKGATHCGAGCTLGDIIAEWLAFLVPAVAVWFGWHTVFSDKMFAVWIVDYLFAFALGIMFQYFTIVPMRNLSVGQGLVQAIKADVLSLTAWQVGMYGFMAIAQFLIFLPLFGTRVEPNTPEFWFTMQIAMLAGFATSYPVNWWLIRRGIKESM